MKSILIAIFALSTMFAVGLAKAEGAAPAPVVAAPASAEVTPAAPVVAAPVVVAPAQPEVPVTDFFSQVFEAIKGFGGFSWWMKISVICMLLVSSMRVSIMKPLWDKLGAFKVLTGLMLSLIIGVVSLMSSTGTVEKAALMAYLIAGGGSIILHQILDAVKDLPMVGPKYDAWIDVVKSFLGGKKA